MALRMAGDFPQALLLYSSAVEVFLGYTLREQCEQQYDKYIAAYVLSKARFADHQLNDAIRLILPGRALPPEKIRESWKEHLNKKRNEFAHTGKVRIESLDIVKAHRAAYKIIRWINYALGKDYWNFPSN